MRFVAVLIIVAFIEVAITVSLARWLGPLLTFALFAIPTTIGLAIQWLRKPVMLEAWNQFRSRPRPAGKGWDEIQRVRMQPDANRAETELWLYWIIVLLLLIPGPLTAATAFFLLLPPVRTFIHFTQRDTAQTILNELPPPKVVVEEVPQLRALKPLKGRSSNAKRKYR